VDLVKKKGNLDFNTVKSGLQYAAQIAMKAATQPVLQSDGTYAPGTFDINKYRAAAHLIITTDLGWDWDKVVKAYGGNPLVAAGGTETEAKSYLDKIAGGAAGGNKVYQFGK
jgi:hypothetical protein